MIGTVRLAREFFEDAAFKDEPLTEREAFLWLIMEASFKARERRVGRKTYNLQRGELVASIRFMQEAWGWATPRRVHSFLCALQKRNMVELAAGTDATVIRLCNYDKYQGSPDDSGTLAERETERSRNTGGTNEKKGEIKVKREANASPVRVAGFQEFWDTYPHRDGVKRGKADAEKKYRAHVKAGIPEQTLLDAAKRLRDDPRVQRGYARDPTTWLNQRGWEDETAPAAAPADVSALQEKTWAMMEAGLRAGKRYPESMMDRETTEEMIRRGALTREEAARRNYPLAAEPLRRIA